MTNDFNVVFEAAQTMKVSFAQDSFNCDFGVEIPQSDYDGPYEATPSSEEQTLPTANRLLAGDIVINPIPSNYGLIEWNGSELTVS